MHFLRVGAGGLLGIGRTHYLVPVDAIVAVDEDRIHLDRDRGEMDNVPTYDPELAAQPDYYDRVDGWWGTARTATRTTRVRAYPPLAPTGTRRTTPGSR